ncbi:MAG: 23S rRNA (adenine(2030)-N(6))-methyltransferase RlmJ [Alphaproteobacteria bacterium]
MLSYRHGFHAGNWADVHKHAALMLLLGHLRQKPKPFCVLDVFAGDGVYDLTAPEALKTGEFRQGIGRIHRRADAPPGVAEFLNTLRASNAEGALAIYPGSPALARGALRDRDRLILCEQHPTAYARLAAWAGGDGRIAVHRRDAFVALKALLPPPIRRGLVLVDPSYEVKADYETVAVAIALGLRRWAAGIYALWYPILPEGRHAALIAAMEELPAERILVTRIAPPAPPAMGLQGAGLVVVNPPWRFDDEMTVAGDWLAQALWPPPFGRHDLRWLKGGPETAKP